MTTTLRGIRSDKLRELARDALDQGFRIDQTGSGHPVLVSPSGDRVWFSTSTSSRDFRGLANCRAGLMRAGYVPKDRRGPKPHRPVLAEPPLITEDVRADVEPIHREEAMTTAAQPVEAGQVKHQDARGGYSFVSKGRAIAAEDVTVDGQPFRIRTNPDGSINATTLRRDKQRTWQRKDGDRAAMLRTLAGFLKTTTPWEDPTPMPEPAAYTNGHAKDPMVDAVAGQITRARARAETVELPTPEPEPVPEPEPEPTPEPEPEPAPSTESDWPGLDEHVDRTITVAAFVDLSAYPIAVALDELDRMVSPAVLALEAAGKDDVAALVRSELAKTPAEVELLALFRELTQRPRLDRR